MVETIVAVIHIVYDDFRTPTLKHRLDDLAVVFGTAWTGLLP